MGRRISAVAARAASLGGDPPVRGARPVPCLPRDSDANGERVREPAGLFDSFDDGYAEQLFAPLAAHPVTASFLTDPTLGPA